MDLGRKLAVFLAKKNIRKKDFAIKIKKHPVQLSYYIAGIVKKPKIETAKLIVEHSGGYITLEDCGHETN